MANMREVKLEIATAMKLPLLESLPMSAQENIDPVTKEAKPVEWLQHFNNTSRFKVCIPVDVYNEIKSNPEINTLAVKQQFVEAHVGADGKAVESYMRFTIIRVKEIVGVL